jgi:hypothetical protein
MSPPDVKPTITGLDSRPSRPNNVDIKPHLSDDEEISFATDQSESFKKQRELLRESYRVRATNLDLEEKLHKANQEIYQLKRASRSESRRPVEKVESGVERDTKPFISKMGEAGPSGAREDIDDDDGEIVFLREVKGDVINDTSTSQGEPYS